MTNPQFLVGIVAGLLFAAVVIALYGLLTRPRQHENPIDWEAEYFASNGLDISRPPQQPANEPDYSGGV